MKFIILYICIFSLSIKPAPSGAGLQHIQTLFYHWSWGFGVRRHISSALSLSLSVSLSLLAPEGCIKNNKSVGISCNSVGMIYRLIGPPFLLSLSLSLFLLIPFKLSVLVRLEIWSLRSRDHSLGARSHPDDPLTWMV